MSEFEFNCPNCDRNLDAGKDLSGINVQCPTCSHSFTVPNKPPVHPLPASPSPSFHSTSTIEQKSPPEQQNTRNESKFKFNCPHCNQNLEAPPEMTGSNAECPGCSKILTIPISETASITTDSLENEHTEQVENSGKKRKKRKLITLVSLCIIFIVLFTVWMTGSSQPEKQSPTTIDEYLDIESFPRFPLAKRKTDKKTTLGSIQTNKQSQLKQTNGRWLIGGDNPLSPKFKVKEIRIEAIERHADALKGEAMKKVREAIFSKFSDTLKNASGDGLSREGSALFVSIQFDRIYDKNTLNVDRFNKFMSRVKLVPAEEITAWQEALTKALGSSDCISDYTELSSRQAALITIVQQDQLFGDKEKTFNRTRSRVFCDRIKNIPSSVVTTVDRFSGIGLAQDTTKAAVAVASYDKLFVGAKFQKNVWKSIVEAKQNNGKTLR